MKYLQNWGWLSGVLGKAKSLTPEPEPILTFEFPVEVCMEGNRMLEDDSDRWMHQDLIIDYHWPTRTFKCFCPHCKAGWTIPSEVLDPSQKEMEALSLHGDVAIKSWMRASILDHTTVYPSKPYGG